jgi:hypothetical protein
LRYWPWWRRKWWGRILFADGERRVVDFGPFLRRASHPAIQAYLDEERFRQFVISNGNVNWNDYDLIFPVADLYAGSIS